MAESEEELKSLLKVKEEMEFTQTHVRRVSDAI